MIECFPTVSCDADGIWIEPIEQENELEFMALLHASQSYEEFMLKSDMGNAQYNVHYFGFSCIEELWQFIKDYYVSKRGFLPNDIE